MEGCIEAMAGIARGARPRRADVPAAALDRRPRRARTSGIGLMPAHRGGEQAALLAQDGLRLPRQPDARARRPPGHGDAVRRRDRPGTRALMNASAITAIRTAAVLGRRDAAPRARGRERAGDRRRGRPGPLARRGACARCGRGTHPDREPHAGARAGAGRGDRRRGGRSVEEAVAAPTSSSRRPARSEPILRREWLKPGAHVNAVGSSVERTRARHGDDGERDRSSSTAASRRSTRRGRPLPPEGAIGPTGRDRRDPRSASTRAHRRRTS